MRSSACVLFWDGSHDVAIRVDLCKSTSKRILLPGASKEAVKAMPESKSADELFFLLAPSCFYKDKGTCEKVGNLLSSLLRRVPITVVDK